VVKDIEQGDAGCVALSHNGYPAALVRFSAPAVCRTPSA